MKKLFNVFLFASALGLYVHIGAEPLNDRNLICSDCISSDTQNFIGKIKKELGMESYVIDVRPLDQSNAMVQTYPFVDKYELLINEPWFKSFSYQAKRFLIGHELMHIKNKHISTQAILCLAWQSMNTVLKQKLTENPWYDEASKKLFLLWYSHCFEMDADISCAKNLKCAEGGIDLLRQMEASGNYVDEESMYTTHPSFKQRIACLTELAQSSEYKKLC